MNHYPGDDTETIADDKSIRVLKKNLCIALLAQVSNLHKKEVTKKCKHSAPSTGGLNDKCYS
jgi:hypothetical protein